MGLAACRTFYLIVGGSHWRMHFSDILPWQSVYTFFRKLLDNRADDDSMTRSECASASEPGDSTFQLPGASLSLH